MPTVLHRNEIAKRLGVKPTSLAAYLGSNQKRGAPRPVRRGYYDLDEVLAFRERKRLEGNQARQRWWRETMAMIRGESTESANDARVDVSADASAVIPAGDGPTNGSGAMVAASHGMSLAAETEGGRAGEPAALPRDVTAETRSAVAATNDPIAEPAGRDDGQQVVKDLATPLAAVLLAQRLAPSRSVLAGQRKGDSVSGAIAEAVLRHPLPKKESSQAENPPAAGLSSEFAGLALPDDPAIDGLTISLDGGDDEITARLGTWLGGMAVVTGGTAATIAVATFASTIFKLRKLDDLARRLDVDVRVPWRSVSELFGVLSALLAGRDPVAEVRAQMFDKVKTKLATRRAAKVSAQRLLDRLKQRQDGPLTPQPPMDQRPPESGSIISNPHRPPESPTVLR